MEILIAMAAGMALGRFAVPERLRCANEALQTACTCLLVCGMGSALALTPGFFSSLAASGLKGLAYCLSAVACSVAAVYAITSRLMAAPHVRPTASARARRSLRGLPGRAARALRDEPMTLLVLASLAAGLAAGSLWPGNPLSALLASGGDTVLYALMCSVGVSVGMRRGLVASLREHHVKMLAIPLGVVAGSLAGGAVASLLCGDSPRVGMAVASGLGWYSLAGVAIEGLAGAQMGAVAFLANLMRELLSFALIPIIARRLNYYACIGVAAATSEDTALPAMIRATDEPTVVFSVVNGIVCSALVPVLIAALLG